MEADPFVGQNNALNCKDVIEVTEVLRSASLADPAQNIQHARAFAERFTQPGKTALNNFISKIAINDQCVERSMPSQINTRTRLLMAEQDICDHSTCRDGDKKFKENCISCGDRVCTHLLDLIIVLMAATGNFGGEDDKTSREFKDKCVPPDSGNDGSDKTANSLKAFSLRIWRKGMKSTGLFKDISVRNNDYKETSSRDDIVASCESNKKENKENTGMKEFDDTKCTSNILNEKTSDSLVERSSGSFDLSLGNTSKHYRHSNFTTNKTTDHVTQRRRLPILTDSTAVTSAEKLIKKLELEKEELRKESNALQSQIEMLIKENKNVKASLTREQTEKEIVTQKCGQIQAQLDEHEDSTRHHIFKLKSQVERLQHAKLAAEQGCLNLSLRQERLAVYEQQATRICQRLIDTIRRELRERYSLFDIASKKYTNSIRHFRWNDYPVDDNGLAMYEAHCHLENYVIEMIKRSKDVHEKPRDCHEQESDGYLATIEEARQDDTDDEHASEYGELLESDSRLALNHHDMTGYRRLNIKHGVTLQKQNGRDSCTKLKRKSDQRSRKGTDKHGDHLTCQGQEIQLGWEETKSLKDLPSCSSSLASEPVTRCNSPNTVDGRQRSCSSIVALVRSGQPRQVDSMATNNVDCSACRRNKITRVKKSMSTCRSSAKMSNVHYV